MKLFQGFGGFAASGKEETSSFVFITGDSFSADSSVSVDNCFTSTYDNYYLFVWGEGTNLTGLDFRWRVGGVDNTSSEYRRSFWIYATSYTQTTDTQNNAQLGNLSPNPMSGTVIKIYSPARAEETVAMGRSGNNDTSTVRGIDYNNIHTVSTAYDGFTLVTDSGTITGDYALYGLIA